MGLFSKSKRILGVDLGSTSIKIVELKKERPVPKLITYGYLEKKFSDIVKEEERKEKNIELLKRLCQKANITTNLAVTALPTFSVFSSLIVLPVLPAKELKEAINLKVKKIIPFPLEEAILDWKILEKFVPAKEEKIEDKKNKENYKILINVVQKKLVKDQMEIFKGANLQLLSLEPEAFAIARSLVGKDPSSTMIIDFSAVSTDLIIVEKTIPVFTRSIKIGGFSLTKEIAQNLNLDLKKAEQFKRDLATIKETSIPSIIEKNLKSLVEEIFYVLESYRSQSGKSIEKIILSGGSAYLPKVDQYFSQQLNIKVIIANPFKRISYPSEIEPALIEVAPRFSVAVGLALK